MNSLVGLVDNTMEKVLKIYREKFLLKFVPDFIEELLVASREESMKEIWINPWRKFPKFFSVQKRFLRISNGIPMVFPKDIHWEIFEEIHGRISEGCFVKFVDVLSKNCCRNFWWNSFIYFLFFLQFLYKSSVTISPIFWKISITWLHYQNRLRKTWKVFWKR